MVVSEKKMSRTKVEPVDQWLAKEGYFRKATPRDPNCLFRSISEQVYHTQHYHLRVRKECVELMEEKRNLFEESIGTAAFNYYIKEMRCFTEYGGLNEIRAMSLCYKRDIIVFVGEKQICENVTNNGFKTAILLCQTESKQYEPVYPMAFIESAAYCQSIVYEVLYKNLFKMYDVKAVADKMLNTGGDTLRHDKFFQKGNLDIREQLIENLYRRVKSTTTDETQSDRNKKVVSNSSSSKKVNTTDVGETQSEWKKAPIPYKVAKALAPDHYRNIELDIWHELKREVKSAGWNRFGNSVLQEGGKCLIEISINDPERQDRNNNKNIRAIIDSSAGESSTKGDQKVKSGNIYLQGYIQQMSANKDTPVLVFIQDLGERQYVPYDALKPIPRKPKQKHWLPMNRSYSIAPDPSRRWKKPFNSFSRKRKPNDTKIAYINAINSDNSSANDVSRSSFENEEHVGELPEDHQKKQLSNSIEDCSTHTELVTSEQTSSSPAEVILNPQSTISNNAEQQKVPEEHKKKNNARNKYEKSNGFGKGLKNSNMKTKALDANNFNLSYENVQIPVNGNPNVPYIIPDGNMYSFCQYVPGKFAENQMDPSFHAWYKVPPVPMYEEAYRSVNPPYYGPLPYGPSHNGVQHLPAPNVQNPYMPDEKHLVNAMQNCSLTCNEGMDTGTEVSNVLPLNMNSTQNDTRPPNQGPKNVNANELPQTPQKGKQTINGKANNRMRARPNNTRRVYNNTQFVNQAAGPSAGTYDTSRRPNMQVMSSPQRYWDPCFSQSPISAGPMNAYGSPQYTSPSVLPPVPYEYSPQNEGNLGNPPVYYAGNGSYAPHFVSPHMDESLHYQHVSESYPPNYSQTGGQPVAYAPVMYQQLMHYLQTPPPQMQDQWNQMMGPSYVPFAALSPTHAEPPSNGPGPVTH